MRRTAVTIGLAAGVCLLFIGCGGAKKTGITPPATPETIKKIPDWYLKPPTDDDFLFATGTATSRDMQLARDKASDAARLEMAKACEVRMQGISKRFQEEVGQAESAQYLDQYTQAVQGVVSTVLTGVSVDKNEVLNENGVFRMYVLLKMPLGSTSSALLERIKQQEQLYTRFRSTQVFEELEKEAQKFEDWKGGK